jgi:hypothetical protein
MKNNIPLPPQMKSIRSSVADRLASHCSSIEVSPPPAFELVVDENGEVVLEKHDVRLSQWRAYPQRVGRVSWQTYVYTNQLTSIHVMLVGMSKS